LKKDDDLNEKILSLEAGNETGLVKGESGAYFAFVIARRAPDMEEFETQKEKLMEETQEKEENDHLNEWYTNLKDETEIVDNRGLYF